MRKLVLIFVFLLLFVGVTNAHNDDWDRDDDYPYVVQPGDTITGIANAFDVEAEDILVRNNIIDPNRIKVGQVLYIPDEHADVDNPRFHVVGYGERLYDIALRYEVELDDLIEENHLGNPDRILPGQVIVLPREEGDWAEYPRVYRVDRGDTLASIGRKFGVSWQQLAAYNNLWNPNYIQAGMLLKIPPRHYDDYDHDYDDYDYDDYARDYDENDYHHDYDDDRGYYDDNGYHDRDGYDRHDDYGYHNGDEYDYDDDYYPTHHYPLTYIVKAGDVLEFISSWYGVSVEAIREFNDLEKWEPIFPGQVLLIPTQYSPKKHHYRPAHHPGWYTVRYGDTLSGIAAYFHVSIHKLAHVNGIHNWNSIYAGQALRIPDWD